MSSRYPLELPDHILRAFEGRPFLSAAEVAEALGVHLSTIRRHVAVGNLTGFQKGLGTRKRHLVFSVSHVRNFINRPPESTTASTLSRLTSGAFELEQLRASLNADPSRPRVNVRFRRPRKSKRNSRVE